jgi:hypothetical protein
MYQVRGKVENHKIKLWIQYHIFGLWANNDDRNMGIETCPWLLQAKANANTVGGMNTACKIAVTGNT